MLPMRGVLGHPEGSGFEHLPSKVQNLPPVTMVSTSGFHMAAITAGGELWTWGDDLVAGGNGLCIYNDAGRWAPNRRPANVELVSPASMWFATLTGHRFDWKMVRLTHLAMARTELSCPTFQDRLGRRKTRTDK